MGRPKKQPVHLYKDLADNGKIYWHLSDNNLATIMPFLDYVVYMVDIKDVKEKTFEGIAYTCKQWYQYLSENNCSEFDADDLVLRNFRDDLMKKSSPNSSGDIRARMRTVNLALRVIYAYYGWLQEHHIYGKERRLLGTSACQITSCLLQFYKGERTNRLDMYPLLYRDAGERSKHRLSFVPGEESRSLLTDYFYEQFPYQLAKRNCLIFDIAWHVGWRRGSILSLTIDQFRREDILQANNNIYVCPRSQKFGYSDSFEVPLALALRVLDYIENERTEIIARFENSANEIFLSSRSGLKLSPGGCSVLFNDARLALNWPRGASLHAFRRGFTNNYIESEIDARMELGLDTSGESIALSLANALGHKSIGSQAAYIRDAQRRLRGSRTFRDKEEITRLSDENAALRAEVAQLRKKIR